MKKKLFLVAMMLVAILALSACSSKEDSNNGTSDVGYNEDNTDRNVSDNETELDDHILYRFPGVSNNNVRATGLCEGVSFVYFEDINGDNKRDIIIGVLYVSGAGPQGMIPYTEICIYEDNGNEFVINKDLCDEVNENLGAEVTAENVKTLIKNSAN